MNIEYETTVRHYDHGGEAKHDITKISPCCNRMKNLLSSNRRVAVIESLCDHREEWHGDGFAGIPCLHFHDPYNDTNAVHVSFCPFCGVAITVAEVKRTNLHKKTTTRTVVEEIWEEQK